MSRHRRRYHVQDTKDVNGLLVVRTLVPTNLFPCTKKNVTRVTTTERHLLPRPPQEDPRLYLVNPTYNIQENDVDEAISVVYSITSWESVIVLLELVLTRREDAMIPHHRHIHIPQSC